MKILKNIKLFAGIAIMIIACLCISPVNGYAQDSTSATTAALNYVKNTFYGNWLIDNQTVMVPKAHSYEFVIQHRFGTINNGYSDFYGIYGSANMRLDRKSTRLNSSHLG